MMVPEDLESAFMNGFSEPNVAAAESAHAAASSSTREGPVAKQRAETAAKAEARKAAKASKAAVKPPAPPPAPAPVAAATEKEAKDKHLKRLAGYRQLRPDLKPNGRAWVTAASSMQEIEDDVANAQHQLGEQPTSGLGTQVLVNSLAAFEVFTQSYNPMALNLKGLGDFSKMKEAEFAPLVEEFMIKHGASLSLSVEFRIVMAIGSVVSLVHIANTNPAVAEALAKSITHRRRRPALAKACEPQKTF